MEELFRSTTNLPYTFVGPPPVLSQPFQNTLNVLPAGVRDRVAIFVGKVYGIHHLAINVELELSISSITDAHRPGILVSGKVVQCYLIEFLPAINAIHNLQWSSLGIIA